MKAVPGVPPAGGETRRPRRENECACPEKEKTAVPLSSEPESSPQALPCQRAADRCFLALFLLAVFLLPAWTLLGGHSGVSYYEQRPLAPLPALTAPALWDGSFFSDAETALIDHIAFRDPLVKTETALELAAGRVKVNGIVVNSDKLVDCYGFSRWDLGYLTAQAEETAARYGALQAKIQSWGGRFFYLGVPLQSTYFADHYPAYMDSRLWHTTAIRERFAAAMAEEGVPFLSMYEVYAAQGMPEAYYFDSDHHYTGRGAFFAYETLLSALDAAGVALPHTDFCWTVPEGDFLGSANRKLYGLWNSRDVLELAVPAEEIPFTRTDNGEPVPAQVFTLPEVGSTLTYSVYMGGDVAETVLSTHRPELPRLLIYGDSFTNPLETMLWTNFDETRSLDLRYAHEKTLEEYLADYRPDVVVCVRDETVFLSPDGNGET